MKRKIGWILVIGSTLTTFTGFMIELVQFLTNSVITDHSIIMWFVAFVFCVIISILCYIDELNVQDALAKKIYNICVFWRNK